MTYVASEINGVYYSHGAAASVGATGASYAPPLSTAAPTSSTDADVSTPQAQSQSVADWLARLSPQQQLDLQGRWVLLALDNEGRRVITAVANSPEELAERQRRTPRSVVAFVLPPSIATAGAAFA